MRKRKPQYRARRWLNSLERRARRPVLEMQSFRALDPHTRALIERTEFGLRE